MRSGETEERSVGEEGTKQKDQRADVDWRWSALGNNSKMENEGDKGRSYTKLFSGGPLSGPRVISTYPCLHGSDLSGTSLSQFMLLRNWAVSSQIPVEYITC